MNRNCSMGKGLVTLCLFILVSGWTIGALALQVKEPLSTLDKLVFVSPEMRIVQSNRDVELAESPGPVLGELDLFRAEQGGVWKLMLDQRRGVASLLDGGAIPIIPGPANNLDWKDFNATCDDDPGCIPPAEVESRARDFLVRYANLLGINPAELVVTADGIGPAGSMYFVNFRQVVDGIPVEGSMLSFRINQGNLIQIGTDKIGPVMVNTRPRISAEEAQQSLARYLIAFPSKDDQVIERVTLVLVPITPRGIDPDDFTGPVGSGFDHALCYRIRFIRSGIVGTWEALIDADSGVILRFVDANRYGRVHGGVYPGDGHTDAADRPFPFVKTNLPPPNDYADAGGLFPGDSATVNLGTGKYTWINDSCGPTTLTTTDGDADYAGWAIPVGTDCQVPNPNPGAAGNTMSSRELFYHLTMVNIKARSYYPTNTWLTTNHINANVNQSAYCNAGSSSGTINFYQSTSDCWNLGEIPGVALHEWGHSWDDLDGSGGDSPPVETRADWTATLQTHDSCTGRGAFRTGNCDGYGDACLNCSGIRDADYTKHVGNTPWTPLNHGSLWSCSGGSYDGPCGWEDHCESGLSTQALWEMVTRDLPEKCGLDLNTAWQLVDRLFYLSHSSLSDMYHCTPPTSNGCGGNTLYELFLAIDDDGDGTANGTPHAAAIYSALARHIIACGTAADPKNTNHSSCPSFTPPVPELSAVAGSNAAVLNWGAVTNATRYLIYRNETNCNSGFTRVATVNSPATTYTDLTVVNGLTYYYRMQAASASDSCVTAMSPCSPVTPQPCAGAITIDRARYNCNDTVAVSVLDSTVGNPITIKAWSTTDGTQKTITLVNNPAGSAIYTGSFDTTTSTTPGATEIRVSPDDTITVRYTDHDYCGTPNYNVDTFAYVDCTGPVISNIAIATITDSTVTITWTTDEPANSQVSYGQSIPPGLTEADPEEFTTSHGMTLTGLNQCSDYYFSVSSTDDAANLTTDTNAGQYYHFKSYGRGFVFNRDTVENGQGLWTVSGTGGSQWHIDSCRSSSPSHAWKAGANDSPTCSADYTASAESYLNSTTFTLGAIGHGYHLRFDEWYDTEQNSGCTYDPLRPQISVDGGSSWTTLATYCGSSTGWVTRDIDLSLFGGSNCKIRFWFHSDGSQNGEGWYVDNIEVSKPAACGPELHHQNHSSTDSCPSGGSGNNNGILDAGETAVIQVVAVNSGTLAAIGISATLSSSTPGVVIPVDTAVFPDLAAGASGTSVSPHFLVSVNPGTACGTVINFLITFSTESESWDDSFTMTVGQPISGDGTIIDETFSSGIPATWTIVDGGTGGGVAATWTTANPGARPATSPITTPFAIVDSDKAGSTATQDEQLITPQIDVASALTVTLQFDQYFYYYSGYGNEIGDVDVRSSLTANAWVNVFKNQGASSPNPDHRTIDLTTQAAGADDLQVRFHYYGGNYDMYWIVDNVKITYTATSGCNMTECIGGPPDTPDGLTATSGCSAVNLQWNPATFASSYKIFRTSNSDCTTGLTQVGTSTSVHFQDNTTGVGMTYYYRIISSNTLGDSGAGNCANAAGQGLPAAPTGLGTAGNCKAVILTWNPVGGATAYQVYRTINGDCSSGIMLIGTSSGTSLNDLSAVGGVTYYYSVKTIAGECASVSSSCVPGMRLPAQTPTITGPNTNTCPTTTLILTTQGGMTEYQWYKNGLLIGGATGYQLIVSANGSYTVSYRGTNGCVGVSASKSITMTVCLPNIVYQSVSNWTPITGDGDAAYELGEKWSASVTLVNNGNGHATNVTAKLAGNGVTVCETTGQFGSIPAGGSANFTFTFVISSTFSPCGGQVGFDILDKTSSEQTPAGANELDKFSISVGQFQSPPPVQLNLKPSSKDVYVDQFNPSMNFGTETTMVVKSRNNRNKRALLTFRLPVIPANATITAATLELYATAGGVDRTLDVHRLTGRWAETIVTWNNQPTYTLTANASLSTGTNLGWKIWNVLPIVQGWVSGTLSNSGLLIKDHTENGSNLAWSFATREYTPIDKRPVLKITYTLPGAWNCSYIATGSCGGFAE